MGPRRRSSREMRLAAIESLECARWDPSGEGVLVERPYLVSSNSGETQSAQISNSPPPAHGHVVGGGRTPVNQE